MPSNALHGKFGVVYLSPSAGTAAVLLSEQMDWSLDFNQPLVDVTALNSDWSSFVKGTIGWTGTFAGNYDPTSNVLWNASMSTTRSNFYLYPNRNDMTKYYYGVGWVALGKVVGGSTTSKASNAWKITGDGDITAKP